MVTTLIESLTININNQQSTEPIKNLDSKLNWQYDPQNIKLHQLLLTKFNEEGSILVGKRIAQDKYEYYYVTCNGTYYSDKHPTQYLYIQNLLEGINKHD